MNYGLRILANGEEIYRVVDLPTERLWNLEEFEFDSLSLFSFDQTTLLAFELLAYCHVGNGEEVNAWDIDEIHLELSCFKEPLDAGTICFADGGKSVQICSGDGMADIFDVQLTGSNADSSAWLITDNQGNILDIPTGPPFDFEAYTVSSCLLWHLGFEGPISGLEIGLNANTLEGCFDLSNALIIDHSSVTANSIATDTGDELIEFCLLTANADSINIQLTDNGASQNQWLITDRNGLILDLPDGLPISFEGFGPGQYLIWNLAFEGMVGNLATGELASELTGCFALSNSVTVNLLFADGGQISVNGETDLEICVASGSQTLLINPELTNNIGPGSIWIITDASGIIQSLGSVLPLDLTNYGN